MLHFHPGRLALLVFLLGVDPRLARAQATFTNNTISGTIRFSNVNPIILSQLNAPGNEGMSNLYVQASSLPPESRTAATDFLPASSRTNSSHQITVDSDATGIRYIVTPRITMLRDQETYYFRSGTSAPVVAFLPGPALNFAECLGVVTVRFRDAANNPLAVDSGSLVAYEAGTYFEVARINTIPSGATEQKIYVLGDRPSRIDLTVNRGASTYTDRIQYSINTNVTVACDAFATVDVAVPSAGTLARASGTVDMLREFELTIDAYDALDYPDYTSVVAEYGPSLNKRYAAVPGMNFTVPSSGTFVLSNLVPSTLDPNSLGYSVSAVMLIRTNRDIEYFHTPTLGGGSNAALVVTPGANISLSNIFVIDPGYLRGRVLLQGPAESLGRSSLLRGMLFASDSDTDMDGVPDVVGIYGVYWSGVGASGVNRRAPGAAFTTSGGYGYSGYKGSFNPTTSAYDGRYELALGGLKGERSLWTRNSLNVISGSGAGASDSDYYFYQFGVTDTAPSDTEIIPGQPTTNDVAYCLSEVCVVFRSANEAFYNPTIRFSYGGYTNTDFQGKPASYSVYLDPAYGVPNVQTKASTTGQLTMYLPQGTYRLVPYITPSNSTYATVSGDPIDLTVGCGQRICVSQCLQVNLNAPPCTSNRVIRITGTAPSCSNNVDRITWRLNGDPVKTACVNCGPNPSFAFDAVLPAIECGENTLTVTASNAVSGAASVTTVIRYDTIPPTIQCPADIVTQCLNTNRAAVTYNVTATDNCGTPPTVVCTPPSGSFFPPGTNTVACYAIDTCGNRSAACSFNVIVRSQAARIKRAVIVEWDCGVLQGADNVDGPYADIPGATSPYCVPSDQARRFYRSRQ